MYISVHNQLTLLHDLLDEHITYKNVTTNEYKQIKKLVQSMSTNRTIEKELLHILPEIYYYGLKGENASSYAAHILENEKKIKHWLIMINQTKLRLSG